jgi:nucleotide-binding universal stress UspA family protein
MALDGQTARLLVGLDGSEGSAAALHLAIKLARAIDAEITAMHVFQFPYPVLAPMAGGAAMGIGGEVGSLEESTRESVKQAFETEWCAPLRDAGVRYREVFGDGRPGEQLKGAAERDNVDLIVVGRRGLGSLAELLAGSVSQYLVHRAERPVLITPHPSERDDRSSER